MVILCVTVIRPHWARLPAPCPRLAVETEPWALGVGGWKEGLVRCWEIWGTRRAGASPASTTVALKKIPKVAQQLLDSREKPMATDEQPGFEKEQSFQERLSKCCVVQWGRGGSSQLAHRR